MVTDEMKDELQTGMATNRAQPNTYPICIRKCKCNRDALRQSTHRFVRRETVCRANFDKFQDFHETRFSVTT